MNSPLNRRSFAVLLLALGMVLLPNANAPLDAQQTTTTTLRIGTVAPNGSPWHRVFSAWSNSLREATGGRVVLQVVTQPTERGMVQAVRGNTLQGAVVSSIGLGQINRSLLVLQAPGAFADTAALDRARTAMDTELRAMFTSQQMELAGWSDLGRGRVFSSRPIRQPSDLRGATVWQPEGELVSSHFLAVAGATPVTLTIAEVRPALGSRVQVVMASAMAVGAMNWNSTLNNVTVQSPGMLVGATVLSSAAVSGLSTEDQAALRSTATRAHTALQRQLRQDDERYYTTLTSRGMTANDNSANAAAWATAEASVRTRITTGPNALFTPALLTRAMTAGRGR